MKLKRLSDFFGLLSISVDDGTQAKILRDINLIDILFLQVF